jgi:hypothetical protein
MTSNGQTSTSLLRTLAFLFIILLLMGSNFLPGARAAQNNTNDNRNKNVGDTTKSNAPPDPAQSTSPSPDPAKSPASNPPQSTNPCPSPQDYGKVKVTDAYKTGGDKEAQLEDEITVKVEGLQILLAKANCSNPSKKILLFLDGRPVKDAIPFPPTDPTKELLAFKLKRTEASRELWTYILGASKWSPRATAVSVGLEDEYPVTSDPKATINIIVIPQRWFLFWSFIFLLILICFWLLAVKSDLLRDTGPSPTGTDERKPYSLARTQAAWWFFLILASYLFIGMITGDFSTTITTTVLGLLGISAGTVVGSAFIDAGKATTQGKPTDGAAGAPAPAVTATTAAVATTATAAAPPKPYVPKNEYWWVDILSDANGISFHRFQVAAWTFVLGIIFIIQVYKLLAMPTFDGSLLALLGISAGTYLGLKIPEPTTPTTTTTPAKQS